MLEDGQVRVRWSRMWLPMLMIIGSGLVVYSNTWRSPFVFDDIHTIVEEEARRTLYFTLGRWFGTRSLPVFSFDLNYYLNGLNVVGYHAVNIGLHLISSVGVFWLGYWLSATVYKTRVVKVGQARITNHLFLGGLAGLIFTVHPVQTQAVTYIVQRLAVMATMFYVLALLGYVKFRLSKTKWEKRIWAGWSLVATLGAMHSKEIAVTLPVMVLLAEVCFFVPKLAGRPWWRLTIDWRVLSRRLAVVLPWLITIVIIPAYMLEVRDLVFRVESEPSSMAGDTFFDKVNLKKVGAVSAETAQISRKTYLLTQLNVSRTYLRLVVWPSGQNLDHDYPLTLTSKDWATIWSLWLHVALWLLAWLLWRKKRLVGAFGIWFFYLALLPESSVIPIIDVMFEHRLYLPMVGAALLGADLGQLTLEKTGQGKVVVNTVVLAMVILLIVLAVAGYKRNAVWKDEISLWTDALAKSPNKARPHNNLGKGYLDRRMFDKAEELYKKEIELDPNSVSGHNNLGSIYGVQGRYDDAIEEINRALAIKPDHDAAYNNLGNVYMLQGKLAAAEEAYQRSIALNTKDAGVYRNLGDVLARQEKYEEAAKAYQQAVSMVPGQALWHSKLGAALGAVGRASEAKEQLGLAIQLNPELASAYSNLGNVLAGEGNFVDAAKAYATYLQLSPGDTAVMSNLAQMFRQLDNEQKAREIWEAIMEIDPENEAAKIFLKQREGQ